MKFPRRYRLQNTADASAGGGTAATTTLITDGAQTTPAAGSTPSTDTTSTTTPAVNVDATAQQTPEQIAAAKAEADKPARVIPEKYEFKAPDGVTFDADAMGEFEGLAREFKLTQEEAQKVADLGPKMMAKWQAKQAEGHQTVSAEWAQSAKADKEFGGDKLTESLGSAKKALDAFATPELRSLLNDSGLGNHPEVIRFMVRAGKAISGDRMVTGGANTGSAPATAAQRMYPSMNP
jgi:hypothetical protein